MHRQRWAEEEAARCLVKAAAAMTEPTPENKTAALLLSAMAIVRIAESDPEHTVRRKAVQHVRRLKEASHGRARR